MSGPVNLKLEMKLNSKLINRINNGAKQAMKEVLLDTVIPTAQAECPVDTGRTRDSISGIVKSRANLIRMSVYTRSGHGLYVEAGTSKMAAHPFLYPAMQKASPALEAIAAERIEQFAELDAVVEDGGYEGLAAAVKGKKFLRKRTKGGA